MPCMAERAECMLRPSLSKAHSCNQTVLRELHGRLKGREASLLSASLQKRIRVVEGPWICGSDLKVPQLLKDSLFYIGV